MKNLHAHADEIVSDFQNEFLQSYADPMAADHIGLDWQWSLENKLPNRLSKHVRDSNAKEAFTVPETVELCRWLSGGFDEDDHSDPPDYDFDEPSTANIVWVDLRRIVFDVYVDQFPELINAALFELLRRDGPSNILRLLRETGDETATRKIVDTVDLEVCDEAARIEFFICMGARGNHFAARESLQNAREASLSRKEKGSLRRACYENGLPPPVDS